MLFIQNEKILSLSLSLWFWVQILILLCHCLWSKVFQSCKGFEQYWTLFHRKKNRSLIQNVKLDFCWCMVRGPKDQRGPETEVRLCHVCFKKSCLSKSLLALTMFIAKLGERTVERLSRLVFLYLSIYLWFGVQIFLLFWHSLWPNCKRNLCLVIFRVLLWSSGRLYI